MKKKLLTACMFILACLSFYSFKIADDPFEILLKKITAYTEARPQEKIHLHLDKPYYAIGDDIWFKAYIIDNSTDKLSGVSNALYVELINENDSVTKQIKLPVIAGLTWGDFKLTDTLPEGNYRIRAYTQWMRNAGPEFFFDKTIKIGNAWANKVFTNTKYTFGTNENKENVNAVIKFSDKTGNTYKELPVNYEVTLKNKVVRRGKATTSANGEINLAFESPQQEITASGRIKARVTLPNKQVVIKNIPIQAASNSISVQLFPEGGNIVENLPVKIAVKAVNAAGLGENVNGTVVDNEGANLFNFSTTSLGMGHFVINPQPGKIYKAIIKLKDGSTKEIPLPKALPSGYVLTVNNTDSIKASARVLISESLLNQGELRLIIQHENNIVSVIKIKPEKQLTIFSLPKKDLPSGIYHLTLFSPENLPVSERIIFINNLSDKIDINLKGLKASYSHRENVPIEFSAKDGTKPAAGSFSVAVTNSSIVTPDPDNESNIFTSLLLTSDLKGYVEKPNSYFINNDLKTRENLDDLMLTQGWSRILWTDVLSGINKPPVFPAEKSLKVSGTITTTGGKPVVKGKVSLFSTAGGIFMIDTLTDDKGHFIFDNLSFGDTTKFVVQARNAKDKKYVEIKLDIIPGQVVTTNKNTGDIEVNVNEAIQNYVSRSEDYFDEQAKRGLLQRSLLLDQVNIVQKKTRAANSANLNGAGNADAVISAKDLGTCFNLLQCLQGRVAGLIIRDREAYLTRNGFNTPMQIIIDGTYVQPDFLDNIQPFDVETIEILKSVAYTSIYGTRGNAGVLIITTKRGGSNLNYNTYAPGIMTYSPKGYYPLREFYSPQYTPGNTEKGTDNRTTVYWNPHVPTDVNGIAKFNFYNTDESGIYRVVIEGINDEGHLARKVYTYEVK